MSVYSQDFREKVLAALGREKSAAAVARRFEIHAGTARSWRRQAEQGRSSPLKGGAAAVPTKLTPCDVAMLDQIVQQQPGITLLQLQSLLAQRGTNIVQSTISRALIKLGYRYKKSHWLRESASGRTSHGVASTSRSPPHWPGPRTLFSLTKPVSAPT